MTYEIPKMLTIQETAEQFGLAKHFVRSLVLDNKVVYVKAGKKYLVNAQKFIEYLSTGDGGDESPSGQQSNGGIRQLW